VKLPAEVRLMPPREDWEFMLTEELEGPTLMALATLGLGFGAFSLREKTPIVVVLVGWLLACRG
jgi:hypothetical protein